MKTTLLTLELAKLLPPPLNVNIDELPKPTEDLTQLENDLYRYGYCYIKNGISSTHLKKLRIRLKEQMEAELEAGIATKDGLEYTGDNLVAIKSILADLFFSSATKLGLSTLKY